MSYYRMVHSSFWTDTKVSENFTPEDRYFYIYLLTNPHANLAGCYELGVRKIIFDTGYSEETVKKLLDRMEKVHDVIRYSWDTNEILILNFKKYNWTRSPKYQKNLVSQIEAVKNPVFREYLEKSNEAFMSGSEVSIPVQTGIDTCPDGYRYDSNLIYSSNIPDTTVLPDNLSDTPKVTINKPDTTKKPSKKSDKPEIYDFKKHSNTENLSYFLDTTDKDYSVITGNQIIREAVELWLDYKTDEFKFTYGKAGLQSLLSEICKNIEKHGSEAVASAIQTSMARGYKGIIFGLIAESNGNSVGGNQRGGYKTKLQMQQEDMQQTYDLAREFANSGGILDD